jgi:uncharacterized protein (DUF433 family)
MNTQDSGANHQRMAHFHVAINEADDSMITDYYNGRITIEPGKRGGRPCIRGLRITVYDVLEYLASDMSELDILNDFPELTSEDIKACLSFAADRERRLRAAIA